MPRKTTPKPPARKAKPKAARVAAIAEGIIEGKRQAQIAREQGISRQAAGKLAGDAGQLICGLVDAHRERLESTFLRVLQVLDDALGAERIERATVTTLTTAASGEKQKTTESALIDLGPDHYARLTAAKRFIELTTAGRPTPRQAEDAAKTGGVTWGELVELVRSKKLNDAATPGR